jgi:hypothetical protein
LLSSEPERRDELGGRRSGQQSENAFMLHRNEFPSTVPLKSDDLELLQRFLEAWCEENHVDMTNEAAVNVASALIEWYQFELSDRNMLKPQPSKNLPDSPRLQLLLQQLKEV